MSPSQRVIHKVQAPDHSRKDQPDTGQQRKALKQHRSQSQITHRESPRCRQEQARKRSARPAPQTTRSRTKIEWGPVQKINDDPEKNRDCLTFAKQEKCFERLGSSKERGLSRSRRSESNHQYLSCPPASPIVYVHILAHSLHSPFNQFMSQTKSIWKEGTHRFIQFMTYSDLIIK